MARTDGIAHPGHPPRPCRSGPAGVAAFLLALAAGCGGGGGGNGPAAAGTGAVALRPAFPALVFANPVAAHQPPGDRSRWFVVEQGGRVLLFPNDPGASATTVFADLRDRVVAGGELGLLGLAFHPGFGANGQVFLSYTGDPGGALVSRVSRFRAAAGGGALDAGSEEVLLTVDQPFSNHNGGQIAFGPDGFLYVGLGDGGAGGDPLGHGQNPSTLLGAILRIDVDAAAPYGIPADNPFAAGGGRPEVYAWGLRNPWRWSFDRETGELWAGDVGQGQWEEVNRIVRGGNYGWNRREGAHCFRTPDCDAAGLIDPVAEYSHAEGCSITGGYVYRGAALPQLLGTYVYGDYCSGRVWGLGPAAGGRPAPRVLLESGLSISSFAEDLDGELYVLDHAGGRLHRFVPAPAAARR